MRTMRRDRNAGREKWEEERIYAGEF